MEKEYIREEQIKLKKEVNEIQENFTKIQQVLEFANDILSKDNPRHETLLHLCQYINQIRNTVYIKRDFDKLSDHLSEFHDLQRKSQYNLIPYAKSIIYRECGEKKSDYHNKPCRIISYARVSAPKVTRNSSFAIQFEGQKQSTREAWLSNLVIDVDLKDEKRLNELGLVSKMQLEKLDHIISVNENLGRKKPKTPEQIFCKAYIKPFKTKYMEDAEDIKQGKLNKGAQIACAILNEVYANVSNKDYESIKKIAQDLSPVSIENLWIKKRENNKQVQR